MRKGKEILVIKTADVRFRKTIAKPSAVIKSRIGPYTRKTKHKTCFEE